MSSDKDNIRILGEGKWLRLVDWNSWEYVERRRCIGVVAIVAVTPEGNLLITEQYRPALRCNAIELPAGLVGDEPGGEQESQEDAALRELEEETGYRAAGMRFLTTGSISSGLTSETVTLFLAEDLQKTGDGGGTHAEDIRVHEVPLNEAEAMFHAWEQNGYAVDLKVYTGLYFALQSHDGK